jgi:predicted lactoylglutathione lyase
MDGNEALLGGEAPAETTAPEGGAPAEGMEPEGGTGGQPSIYGDLEVKWPEGIDDSLKNEHSIKPFVDKEGNLNTANLLKSYVMTKKKIGENKVSIPGENATEEEINEFYEKIGYKANPDEYQIEKQEEDVLQEDFLNKFKDFAHKNKVPVKTANEMANFLREVSKEGVEQQQQLQQKQIAEQVDGLKQEWGKAFDYKVGLAKRVLNEVVKDEAVLEAMQDPSIGSNPAIIKTLSKIGESLFKEDSFDGVSKPQYSTTPQEATTKINEIMGDTSHPYHNRNHPGHKDAIQQMMKLFEIKKQVG